MIDIVNRNPEGIFKAEGPWVQFTELNDSLVVRPATPVLGVTKVVGFTYEIVGNFIITFRYSLDEGLNWSEWKELTLENVQAVPVKRNHWLVIETSFINRGGVTPPEENRLEVTPLEASVNTGMATVVVSSNTTWEVLSGDKSGGFVAVALENPVNDDATWGYFKFIEFEYEFDAPAIPIFYKDFNYSKFIPYYNHFCIDWTLNVLQKIYRKGIVPRFIERSTNDNWDDEDYINFWYPIIYLNALRIWEVDVFNDMLWYPRVLHSWLESKGLILGSNIHLDELFYLMSHFYEEMMRRGTLSLFDRQRDVDTEMFFDVDIRGEFFRLIDGNIEDEIVTALIPSVEQGWIIGYSSPCRYSNTDYLLNFTKCWENKITGITAYPLFNGDHVSYEEGCLVISNTQNDYSGVGMGDPEKQVYVDISKDYFFIVKLRAETAFDLRFGCSVFDNIDNQISLEDLEGNKTDYFVRDRSFSKKEEDIVLFGEIRSAATVIKKGQLDGVCRVLKFPENASIYKVMPFFTVRSLGKVIVSDIRFGLLVDRDTYISSATELYLLAKNNNPVYTEDDLREVLQEKLLPVGVGLSLDIINEINLRSDISNVVLPQPGGSQSVQILMDFISDWNVSMGEDSWFEVTPVSGSGDSSVNVLAGANIIRGERYGQFEIRSGKSSLLISVTQYGLGYVFRIPSGLIRRIGPLKQIITIEGTSNCKGISVVIMESWVRISGLRINGDLVSRWDGINTYIIQGDPGASAPYNFSIDLEIDENIDAPRSTSIEFRGIGDSDDVIERKTLRLQQSMIQYEISVSPLNITIPSSGQSQLVMVETNSGWIAEEI